MEPSPPTSASIGDTAAITQSLLMAMSSELVPLEPASWLWAGRGSAPVGGVASGHILARGRAGRRWGKVFSLGHASLVLGVPLVDP